MDSMQLCYTQMHRDVCVVILSRAPVNALSEAMREQLFDCVQEGIQNNNAKAVVLMAKEGLPFSAGADIKEFASPAKLQETGALEWFQDFLNMLHSQSKPVVAALSGYALGGGLEIALACDYRLALGSVKLGLPEVTLGIVPGGCGTQLLPRVIGVESALEYICSGKSMSDATALKLKLLDAQCEKSGDPVSSAVEWVMQELLHKRLAKRSIKPLRLTWSEDKISSVKALYTAQARGRDASIAAFDCVMKTCRGSLEEGIAFEREVFFRLLGGEQAQALRYVFFSERMATHIPGIKRAQTTGISSVGIVGAGMMGSGIALSCLQKEFKVIITDTNTKILKSCQNTIESLLTKGIGQGRFTEEAATKWRANISYSESLDDFGVVDCVIEAAYENMQVKKDLFKKLDAAVKPDCILATNTSGLDVNNIAASTQRPSSVLGLHFFAPAHVMKLVECVRGQATDDDTLARSLAFVSELRKKPVVVGVCPGFVGNRMIFRYIEMAISLLMRGAKVEEVDKALYDFGMPMGPFVMSDMSGLDLAVKKDPSGDSLMHALCAHGRMGLKSQAGFYNYEVGSREPKVSSEADAIIQQWADARKRTSENITEAKITATEIRNRCLYALINEAVCILEEGVAQRGSDIDIIYVYGYGWPAYRGGPMWYADSIGLERIYSAIQAYKEKDERDGVFSWKVSRIWQELIDSNVKLSQFQVKS